MKDLNNGIMKTILLENGYTANPNSYFCSFTGTWIEEYKTRWSNGIKKPLHAGARKYEGVITAEYGFGILFDYGNLTESSVIKFPKYATETDFKGSFERMEALIKSNYEWEGGLAGYNSLD